MTRIETQAEAARRLSDIERKYAIFFTVKEKSMSDYFEVAFDPQPVLIPKDNSNIPFTIINDLKVYFDVR